MCPPQKVSPEVQQWLHESSGRCLHLVLPWCLGQALQANAGFPEIKILNEQLSAKLPVSAKVVSVCMAKLPEDPFQTAVCVGGNVFELCTSVKSKAALKHNWTRGKNIYWNIVQFLKGVQHNAPTINELQQCQCKQFAFLHISLLQLFLL